MKIVRESISFERGQEPKKAMGLGFTNKIENWYEEAYEPTGSPPYEEMIGVIMEDDELDSKTKQEWVKHLASSGYPWDSEAISGSFGNSIDFVEYLPDGWKEGIHNIEVIKKDGKFHTIFDGWEDWADFVEKDRDMDDEYVSKVLQGDAYDYVMTYDYGHIDAESIKYFIKGKENEIPSLGYLRDLYEFKAGEDDREQIAGDTEEMIDDIFDNYDELKQALQIALSAAQENANEAAAFQKMKKEISNHYELGEAEWDEDQKRYIAPITVDGLERLMDSYWFGERRWEHISPYHGYMEDANVESFEMELDNQLSHNVS